VAPQNEEIDVKKMSSDDLNKVGKDLKTVPISFKCEFKSDLNIHHQGFGMNNQNHSLTILDS
jgi:hypothetical protein